MTWPEGTSVVRFLLDRGKLDTIAPKSAAVAAKRNLERSALRLASARFDEVAFRENLHQRS